MIHNDNTQKIDTFYLAFDESYGVITLASYIAWSGDMARLAGARQFNE